MDLDLLFSRLFHLSTERLIVVLIINQATTVGSVRSRDENEAEIWVKNLRASDDKKVFEKERKAKHKQFPEAFTLSQCGVWQQLESLAAQRKEKKEFPRLAPVNIESIVECRDKLTSIASRLSMPLYKPREIRLNG